MSCSSYVPEEMVTAGEFSELVAGVIWLVRQGKSYVDASKKAECSDSQESGVTYHCMVTWYIESDSEWATS